MKKQYKIISLSLCACLLTGCATVQSAAQDLVASAKALVGLETEEEDSTYVPPEGATQVTGLVLTAYGNEITLQLAVDSSTGGGVGEMSEGMGGGEGMTGELPDVGAASANEGTTMGKPSTETSTDTTGNSDAGTSNSDTTMGGDSVAMGEMSGGMAGGTGEMGGIGEMSGEMGGMSGSMDASVTVDYSSIITLSDETTLYIIPTGTVVEYYGFEMTFSQIAAEQYITITISEDGYILYVEVLG